MERGCWMFWIFCMTALMVTLVPVSQSNEESLGVNCWVCSIQNATCPKEKGKRYNPSIAVTDHFCSLIRNTDALLKELCRAFPHGYHLTCDRADLRKISCKNDFCPADSKPQTDQGNGNSGASMLAYPPASACSAIVALAYLTSVWLAPMM